MTGEQTLGQRINWSAVMTAIGAGISTFSAGLTALHAAGGEVSFDSWQHLIWGAIMAAVASYKGTAKGSLGKKPKPPTQAATDPVGKGG